MAESKPFVIVAVLDVKPGAFDEFHQVALEDAADSVMKEAGCLEFNVLVPTTGTHQLALFEVYTSKEAFQTHMETPHFKKFTDAAERAVSGNNVTEWYMSKGNAK